MRFFSLGLMLLLGFGCQPATPEVTPAPAPPSGIYVSVDTQSLSEMEEGRGILYVFARIPGERMPLRVEYFAVDHVPAVIPFLLDEDIPEVEVVARIAVAGQVERRPEDKQVVARAVPQHPPLLLHLAVNDELVLSNPAVQQVASF